MEGTEKKDWKRRREKTVCCYSAVCYQLSHAFSFQIHSHLESRIGTVLPLLKRSPNMQSSSEILNSMTTTTTTTTPSNSLTTPLSISVTFAGTSPLSPPYSAPLTSAFQPSPSSAFRPIPPSSDTFFLSVIHSFVSSTDDSSSQTNGSSIEKQSGEFSIFFGKKIVKCIKSCICCLL